MKGFVVFIRTYRKGYIILRDKLKKGRENNSENEKTMSRHLELKSMCTV